MHSDNLFIISLTLITMALVGGLSFYLAKDKSTTPKMVSLIGILLSVIPPFGLIYLVFIALNMKNKALLSNHDSHSKD